MPKVSAAHREARREEILRAARRCFADEGFHATSMQDILAEAGLSAGAVYRYFDGKSDIVAAIAGENIASVLAALRCHAARATDLTVADALLEVLDTVRARHDADGIARLALQVWAESARDADLRARFADTHAQFRTIIADLIRRRHPELAADADSMAGAVTALLPGFIHQLALLDEAATKDFHGGVRRLLGTL